MGLYGGNIIVGNIIMELFMGLVVYIPRFAEPVIFFLFSHLPRATRTGESTGMKCVLASKAKVCLSVENHDRQVGQFQQPMVKNYGFSGCSFSGGEAKSTDT